MKGIIILCVLCIAIKVHGSSIQKRSPEEKDEVVKVMTDQINEKKKIVINSWNITFDTYNLNLFLLKGMHCEWKMYNILFVQW